MSAPYSHRALPDRLAARLRRDALKVCSCAEGVVDFTSELLKSASAKHKINRLFNGHAFRELGRDAGSDDLVFVGHFSVVRFHGYNIRKRLAYCNNFFQLFFGRQNPNKTKPANK